MKQGNRVKLSSLDFFHEGCFVLLAVVAVYSLVGVLLAQCEFFLVNDFSTFHLSRQGGWQQRILGQFFHPRTGDNWLYRPVPESLGWGLSIIFRGAPGAWHVVILAFRLLSIGLTWVLLGSMTVSVRARALGTLYVAFFPAFPESQLIYAEAPLIPLLLLTCIGVNAVRRRILAANDPSPWAMVGTTLAFVLLSMCKETFAPVTLVLLVSLFPLIWKARSALFKVLFTVMSLAWFVQAYHFYLMISQPYAQGVAAAGAAAGSKVKAIMSNLAWIWGDTFMTHSIPIPAALLLFGVIVLGIGILVRKCLREQKFDHPAIPGLVAFALISGVNLMVPYQALRYLYPGAVLITPVLAVGMDSFKQHEQLSKWLYRCLAIVLVVFGAPGLLAQALSMKVSSRADWAYLGHLAESNAQGRDIVFIDNPAYERRIWIQSELSGLNLTGKVSLGPRTGAIRISGPDLSEVDNDAIVTPINPRYERGDESGIPPNLVATERFDFTRQGNTYRALARMEAFGKRLNSLYQFPADAGSTRFPGHYWQIYKLRNP